MLVLSLNIFSSPFLANLALLECTNAFSRYLLFNSFLAILSNKSNLAITNTFGAYSKDFIINSLTYLKGGFNTTKSYTPTISSFKKSKVKSSSISLSTMSFVTTSYPRFFKVSDIWPFPAQGSSILIFLSIPNKFTISTTSLGLVA